MKRAVPGIEIPEGESCSLLDGKCALFDWGLEGPAFCAGYGGLNLVGDGLKHPECLALCGIVSKKPDLLDEKYFRNPQKPWEHTGKFSLEIDPHIPESVLQTVAGVSSIVKKADRIILTFGSETGKISLSPSGIVLDVGEGNRHWHYRNVKAIRDGEGKILWRNDKRKKLPRPQVSQRRIRRAQNLD